uniref:C-type lectin domain-containing protein n=1 Tax=Sphaeramia orbicularis TaxID=375764 RepID=A0A673AIW0_9TELE
MSFFVHLLLLLCPVYEGVNLRPLKYIQYTSQNPGLKTWKEAQEYCREHHSDLATIRNHTENAFITSLYGWIGLYRDGPNCAWKWSRRNETADFIDLSGVVPCHHRFCYLFISDNYHYNEHCAHKYSSSTGWRSTNCNIRYPFICYDEPLILVKEKKTNMFTVLTPSWADYQVQQQTHFR